MSKKKFIIVAFVFILIFSVNVFAVPTIDKTVVTSIFQGNNIASEPVPEMYPNNNRSNSYSITFNRIYNGILKTEFESDWYMINIPTPGKITVFMNAPDNPLIDYDLHLYTLTGEQLDSFEESGVNEEIIHFAQSGNYFIQVDSVVGFDSVKPYGLLVTYTENYDQVEVSGNESFVQAMKAGINSSSTFSITGTIDNLFDNDFNAFSISSSIKLSFNLNEPAGCNYVIDIYRLDTTLTYVQTILDQVSSTSLDFTGTGLFFACVRSKSGYSPNSNYTVAVKPVDTASSIILNNVIAQDTGGHCNYGQGYFWRARYGATFQGYALKSNGTGAANVPVNIYFYDANAVPNKSASVTGYTDSNGYYSIYLALPHAAGVYLYKTIVGSFWSYHYYDVGSIAITSGNAYFSQGFYLFAYQLFKRY